MLEFKVGDKVQLNEKVFKENYLKRWGYELPNEYLWIYQRVKIIGDISEAFVEDGKQLYYVDFDDEFGTCHISITDDLKTLNGNWEKLD